MYGAIRCHQIFSVNYGLVKYVDRSELTLNSVCYQIRLSIVISKISSTAKRESFGFTLSALGMSHFILNDGGYLQFVPALQFFFDFRAAIADSTIIEILYSPDCDIGFLEDNCESSRFSALSHAYDSSVNGALAACGLAGRVHLSILSPQTGRRGW
jgi:hypothetical protein